MSWSRIDDLKTQLLRLWERGELLRDLVNGNNRFPLRLTLKAPNSTEISERFQEVRAWTAELAACPLMRLEWREIQHRVQGSQRLPNQVWIDSIHPALEWLDKRRDWQRFQSIVTSTQRDCPALRPWLERHPLRALVLSEVWQQLLAVVRWIADHPHPGIYLRQVDLPGLHSKFIESHRGVLAELLDLALPEAAVDHTRTGTGQFSVRYGFREKPLRIRFRLLDAETPSMAGLKCPDMTLDADNFSRLRLPVRHLFITENETNFLAFPAVQQGMVIFGAGYGWEGLARSRWLNDCRLYYWGDIDTHGFVILDRLRNHFPQVVSFLMDQQTLLLHRDFWGLEEQPASLDLHQLTPEEHALYETLRSGRIRRGLRLEQELIRFDWLKQALTELLSPAPAATATSPTGH